MDLINFLDNFYQMRNFEGKKTTITIKIKENILPLKLSDILSKLLFNYVFQINYTYTYTCLIYISITAIFMS